MVRLDRHHQVYRDAGALHTLVNLHGFIDQQAFLTKSGDVGLILGASGIDDECFTPEEAAHVTHRLCSALRIFDERCRVYQFLRKRERPVIPPVTVPHPVARAAIHGRLSHLATKADALWEITLSLAVVYDGAPHRRRLADRLRHIVFDPRRAIRERLSTDAAIRALDDDVRQTVRTLRTKVESFVIQLRDVLAMRVLSKDEAFVFLHGLLNLDPTKNQVRRARDLFLDYYLCDSAVECHREHLRVDDDFVRILTLKEPPAQTFAHVWRDLQQVPANVLLVSEWRRHATGRVRRQIQAKRRHFHHARASLMNYLNAAPTPESAMLIDEGAVATVADLGACLAALEVDGHAVGEYALTVLLHDRDRARLDDHVAACIKVFAAHDAVVIDERYNLLNALLAIVPGNAPYNLRRFWLLDTNYADSALLFAPATGATENTHLKRPYLAVLETDDHTPYYFNLHHEDVAHTLILGSTGSGKSFLVNFLVTHAQQYEPSTVIFDLGGGYQSLTSLFDGAYLPLSLEGQHHRVNPFCLEPTKEHLHFLSAFVRVLLESGGTSLTLSEEHDLTRQVANVYEVDPEQRRLLTLASMLPRPMAQRLDKWVGEGVYASLFDNAIDTLTFARFQTFDFEGLDRYPQALEALLFYILYRTSAVVADSADVERFKLFVMDEAWRFFRHPTIQRYLLEALKTWRKKNAALLLATQSSQDLDQAALLPIIVESCPTKMFLANPGMARAGYGSLFHLNERELALIESLIPKQQLLLKRPDGAKVLNLEVDPKSYWLYTSNPFEQRRRADAVASHGLTRALDVLTESSPTTRSL